MPSIKEKKNGKRTEKTGTALVPRTSGNLGVIDALTRHLANAVVLYFNYKKYHWESAGPQFRDLHLLFDEQATILYTSWDVIAERIRIIGGHAIHTPTEIEKHATVVTATEQPMAIDAMLQQARENTLKVIGELKVAITHADSAGDPGSEDLFIQSLREYEKQAWFLREVLATRNSAELKATAN